MEPKCLLSFQTISKSTSLGVQKYVEYYVSGLKNPYLDGAAHRGSEGLCEIERME